MLDLDEVLKASDADRKAAGRVLSSLLTEDTTAGDLLALDYAEATVLIHDALRQTVGGLPMGCLLLATRIAVNTPADVADEDAALILLRVTGRATLPNDSETAMHRLDAGFRATDTRDNWDSSSKADQFTLNRLRHAGMRCAVLGTFRMLKKGDHWRLTFGADIPNFYPGQGMKVYKPRGEALKQIVNYTNTLAGSHPLAGKPVEIGRLRYSSSEREVSEAHDNVTVCMEPTDLLARRTALFGMSRTGKSNTIKIIASAIFNLRERNAEKGRVGQLIFDVNGEYCNDNPQDRGCLRSVWKNVNGGNEEDVITYGLFGHPNDQNRRLIKVNFFGKSLTTWDNLDNVKDAMGSLVAGKNIIDEHLIAAGETARYVKNFIESHLEVPARWGKSEQVRYRRWVAIYRAFLAQAGFSPPVSFSSEYIRGLFSKEFRGAMRASHADNATEYATAARTLEQEWAPWAELFSAFVALGKFIGATGQGADSAYQQFNNAYQQKQQKHKHAWDDDTLRGLLSLAAYQGGISRVRDLRDRHDSSVSEDYSVQIVNELVNGKLVIVDQSVGAPSEIKFTAERIMWAIFNRQKDVFIKPPRDDKGDLIRDENGDIRPPPDIIVYAEEAHNLLPAKDAELEGVWARTAKEGSKFRIGLVYSTQEPSSILSNILKNTDNWFVAHLNNSDETRELKKYYDFEMFIGQILKVPDVGFLRMRCLSNPYIVPVQVKKFEVADGKPNGV